MKTKKKISFCRERRKPKAGWLRSFQDKLWLQMDNHIAQCPKCQGRMIKLQRTETALQILRTQPMAPDLLRKANERAIHILKKDLRDEPAAQKLKTAQPCPDWTVRNRKMLETLFGAAACLMVLVLLKTGIFSSMKEIENDGRAIVHKYYDKHLDDDLMNDLFSNSKET